jgi:phosphohistidine swiveling domain-containing protein
MRKSGSNYRFVWGNRQSHLTVDMNLQGLIKFGDIPFNDVKAVIEISKNNRIDCYHSAADLKNDDRNGRTIFFNKELSSRFINSSNEAIADHWKLYGEVRKVDFSKLSNGEIFKHFIEMVDDWCRVIGFFRATQESSTRHLLEEIQKVLSEDDFSLAVLFSKPDPVSNELKDWQTLLKKTYSREKMLGHAYEYPWIVSAHFTCKDVFRTLKSRFDHDRDNLKIRNIQKEKRELCEKQKNINYGGDRTVKHLVVLVQKLALHRLELKSCWAGIDFYLLPLLKEVSRRFEVDMSDLGKNYIVDDMEKLLLHNKKLSQGEIAKRKKCFVGFLKRGKIIFKSGSEAQKFFDTEMKVSDKKTKEISQFEGLIANKGKSIGVVRILEANNSKQASFLRKNFKKGEILVTQMTQPNIMDIASRAGAIIADEGGMLSHAAIISRELKIPCIVNTNIATKVLQDGGLVEVDADRGIVRILKKLNK